MRVGFAGTPAFAATVLEAILSAGFPIELVLTQPDRPHGRGLKREPGPVKSLALKGELTVLQPTALRSESACAEICATPLDVLVVAAYGLILPLPVLRWPRHGCINVHASLLPRWRGAAPIERALIAGDRQTGISIMQMDEGLDTGPVAAMRAVPIEPRETAGTLLAKLASAGAHEVVQALAFLERQASLALNAQTAEGVTYAPKIARGEATLNWDEEAASIDRKVRAFDPVPGAQTSLAGEPLKIWRADPVPGRFGAPGAIVQADNAGIVVACGDGALIVRELQRAGGRRLPASAFLAGRPLEAKARFGRHA